MIADELTTLVEGAYAMALDPDGAGAWLDACIGLFGAAHAAIGMFDRARQPRLLLNPANRSDLDRYNAAGIAHLDPQLAFLRTLRGPRIYFDTDHVDESQSGTREFQSWLRSEARIGHHMTAFVPLRRGQAAGLSLHGFARDGFFSSEQRQCMAAMFSSLDAAFRLGFDHADKLNVAFWEGVASAASEQALLLDDRGMVVRLTACARALLARRDAIDVVGGRLCCGEPDADGRLQAAIANALRLPVGTTSAVRLPHRRGRPPLVATVDPLTRSHRPLAPYEAAVLVTLVDPVTPPPVASGRHVHAFGLTPREGELAAALLAGHSIESAAASLSIAVATARLHLRQLLAKTGTSRQVDLIRLLTRV